jgi:hypothetical protein
LVYTNRTTITSRLTSISLDINHNNNNNKSNDINKRKANDPEIRHFIPFIRPIYLTKNAKKKMMPKMQMEVTKKNLGDETKKTILPAKKNIKKTKSSQQFKCSV